MGEAQRKLLDASKLVKFDLASPKYVVSKGDRAGLERDGGNVIVGVTHIIVGAVVDTKFPQGAQRGDRKIYAAWIESLDSGDVVIEMPKSQLLWLYKIAKAEDLALNTRLSQWGEALVDAIEVVLSNTEDTVGT